MIFVCFFVTIFGTFLKELMEFGSEVIVDYILNLLDNNNAFKSSIFLDE